MQLFNDTLFTGERLHRQIRSYLATRILVRENKFDFISIKCQPELSNGYCLQCLNNALLNLMNLAISSGPDVPGWDGIYQVIGSANAGH